MALLDVNVLVALAWESHVHHVAATTWFDEFAVAGWSTCPITESGFVRVSANPRALPVAVSIKDALVVLAALRTKPADGTSMFFACYPLTTRAVRMSDQWLMATR